MTTFAFLYLFLVRVMSDSLRYKTGVQVGSKFDRPQNVFDGARAIARRSILNVNARR